MWMIFKGIVFRSEDISYIYKPANTNNIFELKLKGEQPLEMRFPNEDSLKESWNKITERLKEEEVER